MGWTVVLWYTGYRVAHALHDQIFNMGLKHGIGSPRRSPTVLRQYQVVEKGSA